ncbi:DUF6220 domain-containing protein [Intrasporangium sp.]|uniref:DUF6220 domain-containing protein n=1 Tax=Intrasporangium sp. TaxID=1925024 RepID=UPI00293A5083|nr:DUF6220 domain-containing protein [Intrasporangium sp.]MDV3220311.1 DUF6220 domain-containing protein [Intrasporangium sp.]
MRKVFTGLTALLLLAVVLQFFFAGSGAFDPAPNDESFGPHRSLGYLTVVLTLVTAVAGALARVPGRVLSLTVVVLGLVVLQPVLAVLAGGLGEAGSATTPGRLVSGLHALNAVSIVAVLGTVIRRARELAVPAAATPRSHASTAASPTAGSEPGAGTAELSS